MSDVAAEPFRLRDYQAMIAKIARKRVSVALACGVRVEFDDLMQEAAIAFDAATRGFDPARGVKFSTYLWRAVANHLTRYCDRLPPQMASMDEEFEEDGGTLHDLMAADDNDPTLALERAETAANTLASLSADARRLAALLLNPPASLVAEYDRARAFAERCVAHGYAQPIVAFDIRFVMRALGYDRPRRVAVADEFWNRFGIRV